jgi:three-Cys-motif partner protein
MPVDWCTRCENGYITRQEVAKGACRHSMSKRLPVIWNAEPHTIAKIAILKGYLHAWFRILAKTRRGQTLLYVDGFAGPGYYRNHDEGSPLAAVRVAQEAIDSLGGRFVASRLHCAFIEADSERFKAMSETVAPFAGSPSLRISTACEPFVEGIQTIRKEVPGPFRGEGPLLIFADPFGGTDTPFKTFAECMQGDTAELLINLDADGVARIFFAESNNRRDEQLTKLFGGEYWRARLTARDDLKRLSVQILDLYKERLKTLAGVRFIWSFAMRGKHDSLNYHLVFAAKHPLGMKKMKEAMRQIDKTGAYSFSDAHVDQHSLFRADDADVFANMMFRHFEGHEVPMEDVTLYALNETPFLNAKSLLGVLERSGRLRLKPCPGESIRAGAFPENKIKSVCFGKFAEIGKQANLDFDGCEANHKSNGRKAPGTR